MDTLITGPWYFTKSEGQIVGPYKSIDDLSDEHDKPKIIYRMMPKSTTLEIIYERYEGYIQ